MNIDLLKCSNHLKTGEYPESVFSHGFLPLITNLTHLTDHSATLIDHIYANKQDIYIRYYYKRYFGSFCCVRDHKTENIKQPENWHDHFHLKNIENFSNLLISTNFETVFKEKCPGTAYNALMGHYLKAYNIVFPFKHVKIPKIYVKRLPWMTKGLNKSSISKAKLLKKPNGS